MGPFRYIFWFVSNHYDRNNFCFDFSFVFDFNYIVTTGTDYNTDDNHGTKVAWY